MCKILTVFIVSILMLTTPAIYAQWMQVPSSPSSQINDIVEFNGVLYLAHGSAGVYKSTDSTATWQLINNGFNTTQAKNVYQLLVKGDTIYAATVDGIYKSTNAGNNWVKKSSGINIGPGALYEFAESIFEHNNELFAGAWSGIYRSADGAENWLATNVSGFATGPGFFINHNGTLFAARENINLPYGYKSIDGGVTWDSLTSIPGPVITFLSEPGHLWAGTIFGVWLSTDNGASWEDRNNGLALDPYSSCIIRVNGWLITSLKFGGSGMYLSADEGMNWEDFSAGLPFLSTIEKLIIYGNKIIAATSDGLWQRDTTEILTALQTQTSPPVNFKLYPNYPNPFNPTTNIQYTIGSREFISLKVYDLLGKEIATLVHEEKPAGDYKIELDASYLSSGIYFYQLRAGDNFTQTKKMILMR